MALATRTVPAGRIKLTVHNQGAATHELVAFRTDLPETALPTVADKSFLVTIGDRSVGGMCARDQMVGPWQVPVADCAVTTLGYRTFQGEAMVGVVPLYKVTPRPRPLR